MVPVKPETRGKGLGAWSEGEQVGEATQEGSWRTPTFRN